MTLTEYKSIQHTPTTILDIDGATINDQNEIEIAGFHTAYIKWQLSDDIIKGKYQITSNYPVTDKLSSSWSYDGKTYDTSYFYILKPFNNILYQKIYNSGWLTQKIPINDITQNNIFQLDTLLPTRLESLTTPTTILDPYSCPIDKSIITNFQLNVLNPYTSPTNNFNYQPVSLGLTPLFKAQISVLIYDPISAKTPWENIVSQGLYQGLLLKLKNFHIPSTYPSFFIYYINTPTDNNISITPQTHLNLDHPHADVTLDIVYIKSYILPDIKYNYKNNIIELQFNLIGGQVL